MPNLDETVIKCAQMSSEHGGYCMRPKQRTWGGFLCLVLQRPNTGDIPFLGFIVEIHNIDMSIPYMF